MSGFGAHRPGRPVSVVPPLSEDPELRAFYEAVAEALNRHSGILGDPMDRSITLRDLYELGLLAPGFETGIERGPDSVRLARASAVSRTRR